MSKSSPPLQQSTTHNHVIMVTDAQILHPFCDLCNTQYPLHNLEMTTTGSQLCKACAKHLYNIPSGKMHQCVERYLMGNVV